LWCASTYHRRASSVIMTCVDPSSASRHGARRTHLLCVKRRILYCFFGVLYHLSRSQHHLCGATTRRRIGCLGSFLPAGAPYLTTAFQVAFTGPGFPARAVALWVSQLFELALLLCSFLSLFLCYCCVLSLPLAAVMAHTVHPPTHLHRGCDRGLSESLAAARLRARRPPRAACCVLVECGGSDRPGAFYLTLFWSRGSFSRMVQPHGWLTSHVACNECRRSRKGGAVIVKLVVSARAL